MLIWKIRAQQLWQEKAEWTNEAGLDAVGIDGLKWNNYEKDNWLTR